MSPPRHAFPSDAGIELASKRLVWLKAFAGAAAVLLTIGASAALWSSKHATRDDVEQVKSSVMSPLSALESKVQVLSARAAVVESSMADLKDDLRFIRAQLFEIAKSTGARTVAPPPPEGAP